MDDPRKYDQNGVIRWAFAEWDDKKRADPVEVLKAVKAVAERR